MSERDRAMMGIDQDPEQAASNKPGPESQTQSTEIWRIPSLENQIAQAHREIKTLQDELSQLNSDMRDAKAQDKAMLEYMSDQERRDLNINPARHDAGRAILAEQTDRILRQITQWQEYIEKISAELTRIRG